MTGKLDYSKLSDEELQHIANDDYSKLSDATLKKLAAEEATTKNVESSVDKDQLSGNRIAGAAVGAGAGMKVAPFVAGKYVVSTGLDEIAKRFPRQTPSVTVEAAPAAYNTPHGVGAGAVKNDVHNIDMLLKNKVGQEALETPGYKSPGNSRILMPEGVAAAEEAAQATKAATAAKDASMLTKAKEAAGKYGKFITPGGIPGKVLNTVMPIASLAGAGAQTADALTRFQHGDVGRGIVSGVGALGSAASAIPHPATRLVGTGLSLAAPAINYGIDKLYGRDYAEGGSIAKSPDMPTMAREIMEHHLNYKKGGNVAPKPEPEPEPKRKKHTIYTLPDGLSKEEFMYLCQGGHVEMAEGGQPPKPDANEGSAFVGYPQINRNRKVGSGTGFLDAALGAPSDPNRSSVLNPNNASYLEGYEKGEPYGIAGMALPFAGMAAKPLAKALAPKAASMAEDYLTRIGGIAHAVPNAKMSPGKSFGETFSKSNPTDPIEKLKYDRYKMSQVYPDVIPPVLAKDPKTGKEFLQKANSPEALEVQKARKAAQKEIDKGNYEPHFDVNQRYYADPTNYPTAGYTQTDIVPKKAETIAKYTELANNPESLARLRGAFEKGKDRPAAKDWYAMGQLEEAFIKELGVEEGRKQFKNRFADAMAATTGGADPNSNLMMAAFTNYQKSLGKEIPTKAADLPFPIGGRFVSGNMDQAKKLAEMGEIPVTNPKRHNFSANFLGHRDVSTIDEQMSQLWDPKMMSPPPNAYGIYQKALADEAAKAGVNPSNFQDVAWAGAKDYPGKPMMQEINEMLARTSKITGEPQEKVLKGFIHGNKPMYGLGALGVGASQDDISNLDITKKSGGKVKKK